MKTAMKKLSSMIALLLLMFCDDCAAKSTNWNPSVNVPLRVEREDTSFWLKSGQDNLRRILAMQNVYRRARNVILFIGDGMGLSTITSGRIYKGQMKGNSGEEYKLVFEEFPNTGFSKTYNTNKQVPDSAGTATAILSGVKAQYRMLGLSEKAQYDVCNRTNDEESRLTTIADWAQDTGMDTGFVTTTRVTHATPGALYAHVNNRDWECDGKIPPQYRDVCVKDIARQLIEDAPGNKFKVIMGGGGGPLGLKITRPDRDCCHRLDNRELHKTWLNANPHGRLVTTSQELMSVNFTAIDKLMGIFADSHMPYAADKPDDVPTLANMTLQAIRLLRKNKNGYFLLVEGGKIDLAHHQNYAKLALREVAEFDDAIQTAIRNVDLDETLIIVTADHSHAFTMNGYPERGNSILGLTTSNSNDPKTYETLSYANGPGYDYHRVNDSAVNGVLWRDLENDAQKATDLYYRHFSPRYLKDETHGGEDVGVYAIGPYSHLFRSTFEQNYIAHAVAYAACFKNWASHCDEFNGRYYYDIKHLDGKSSANAMMVTLPIVIAIMSLATRCF